MPRREEPAEPDEPEDDSELSEEDSELSPGDDEEIVDWQELEDQYNWLDGLDYLDDIFDYPEDDDWYEE